MSEQAPTVGLDAHDYDEVLEAIAELMNTHSVALYAPSYPSGTKQPVITLWDWPGSRDKAVKLSLYDDQSVDGARILFVQVMTRGDRIAAGGAAGLAATVRSLLHDRKYLRLAWFRASHIKQVSAADVGSDDSGRDLYSTNYQIMGSAVGVPERLPEEGNFS